MMFVRRKRQTSFLSAASTPCCCSSPEKQDGQEGNNQQDQEDTAPLLVAADKQLLLPGDEDSRISSSTTTNSSNSSNSSSILPFLATAARKQPPARSLIIIIQMLLILMFTNHVFLYSAPHQQHPNLHHQSSSSSSYYEGQHTTTTSTSTTNDDDHAKSSRSNAGNKGSSTSTAATTSTTSTSIKKRTFATKQQENAESNNDISWLDHIQLGKWIGSGGWSDAFEAIIDKDYNPWNKSYIIKFTGDIAVDGDVDYAKSSITAVEVIKRLSPHPSIPENLYFCPRIPNPFPKRFQVPNTTQSVGGTTGAEKMNRKRLLTSKHMAVQVSERVTQTHKHMHGWMPGDKLRCFLYRFFEVLDYAHSKNIMMIDLVLYNVILQDGVMKFIDWSDSMIFETSQERKIRMENNITYPYSFCSRGICSDGVRRDYKYVHEYDVKKLAYRIRRLLKYYKEKDMDYNSNNKDHAEEEEEYFISTKDRKLIYDLTDKMSKDKPAPSLRWLLNHHKYFTVEDNSNCTLLW